MRFALFAPTKVAGRWGQGFAIIVIVAIIAARRGVIGNPKGFGLVGNRWGVIGKRVGVRRGAWSVASAGSILGSLKVAFGC